MRSVLGCVVAALFGPFAWGQSTPELSVFPQCRFDPVSETRVAGTLFGMEPVPEQGVAVIALSNSGIGVVDVSQPDDLQIVATLPDAIGARAVSVVGSTAYVAAWNLGLYVVDVSDPAAAAIVATVPTPGLVRSAAAQSGLLVVGGSSGLYVYDISFPFSPVLRATLPALDVRAVTIAGRYAIVCQGEAGIAVVDLADAMSPVVVSTVDTFNAREAAVRGDVVYLADGQAGLVVIDLTVPEAPTILRQIPLSADAIDVDPQADLVYVTTSTGVAVIDAGDNAGIIVDAPLPNGPRAAFVSSDGRMFAAARLPGSGVGTGGAVYALPIAPVEVLERVVDYLRPERPHDNGVQLSGGLATTAVINTQTLPFRLLAWDYLDPDASILVSLEDYSSVIDVTPTTRRAIAAKNTAPSFPSQGPLDLVDLSDTNMARPIGGLPGGVRALTDQYAFMTSDDQFRVFDIAGPSPFEVAAYSLSDFPVINSGSARLRASGDALAAFAHQGQTLAVFDASDPVNVLLRREFAVDSAIADIVFLEEDRLLVTLSSGGLVVAGFDTAGQPFQQPFTPAGDIVFAGPIRATQSHGFVEGRRQNHPSSSFTYFVAWFLMNQQRTDIESFCPIDLGGRIARLRDTSSTDAIISVSLGESNYAVLRPTTRTFPCSPADLADPRASLTFADIAAFLTAYTDRAPGADIAQPYGELTFADITAFLQAFAAGCP